MSFFVSVCDIQGEKKFHFMCSLMQNDISKYIWESKLLHRLLNSIISDMCQQIMIAGVAARVFEWGGQKFDIIINLPHYAWMTDKIVRPEELLIPPKNSPLYLKL